MSCNFYGRLHSLLVQSGNFSAVTACSMPDPSRARRKIWLPHLLSIVRPGDVVVGHSSGAQAAMRLAEVMPLRAAVLVSACHSDLGDEGERAAGWYPPEGGPWEWETIKRNCGSILQFHSEDDPFIAMEEARVVHENTNSTFFEFENLSHFFDEGTADVISERIFEMMKQSKEEGV